MKNMKKILALVIAALMLVSMMSVAFAAPENKSLTVPSVTGHTYSVFQIFKGDLADGVLSNIVWGANGAGTVDTAVSQSIIDALDAITSDTTDKSQATIDNILTELGISKASLTDASAYAKDVAAGTTLSVPTGYYIVRDKDGSAPEGSDEAYTLLLINVVGDVTMTAKMDVPELEKKVKDKNDSNSTSYETASIGGTDLLDSADYDIGDDVPFVLTATLADNVSSYKKYHITFVDTLESGKFSDISALTIKLNGEAIANGTGYTVSTSGYAGDVAPTAAGFTQTVEFTPAGEGAVYLPTSLNSAVVTVEFTAKLGEGANIGSLGNKNESHLEYSNNPNDDQGGEEGHTPDDKVKVFTYKLVVNKVQQNGVDDEGKPIYASLTGANFTLYKKVAAATTTSKTGAQHKADITNTSVEKSALVDAVNYEIVAQNATETDGDTFTYKGLDDGTYVLVETTIPAGFNAFKSITFEITATHSLKADEPILLTFMGQDASDADKSITLAPEQVATSNSTSGTVSTDVLNNSGATLPSTGGMGTTILYIGGSILVILAAILLITKRRMSGND